MYCLIGYGVICGIAMLVLHVLQKQEKRRNTDDLTGFVSHRDARLFSYVCEGSLLDIASKKDDIETRQNDEKERAVRWKKNYSIKMMHRFMRH